MLFHIWLNVRSSIIVAIILGEGGEGNLHFVFFKYFRKIRNRWKDMVWFFLTTLIAEEVLFFCGINGLCLLLTKSVCFFFCFKFFLALQKAGNNNFSSVSNRDMSTISERDCDLPKDRFFLFSHAIFLSTINLQSDILNFRLCLNLYDTVRNVWA